MKFKQYQHIERINTSSVDGLLKGKCYITPKIDGTNASIWLGEDGEVHCGSRKRDLTVGDDNAEFIKKNGGKSKATKDKEGYGETETSIVNTYITEALIDKEKAKIELEKGGWESKYIGQLLGTIYHCLIEEEMWNILKKYKNPTINFKQLQALTIAKIKELKEDLFC